MESNAVDNERVQSTLPKSVQVWFPELQKRL